jgi:hypothetical protein
MTYVKNAGVTEEVSSTEQNGPEADLRHSRHGGLICCAFAKLSMLGRGASRQSELPGARPLAKP